VALTGETNTAGNILMRKPLGNLSLCMPRRRMEKHIYIFLTHCGRVIQICVFNMVKLVTSASSP